MKKLLQNLLNEKQTQIIGEEWPHEVLADPTSTLLASLLPSTDGLAGHPHPPHPAAAEDIVKSSVMNDMSV